MGSKNYHKTICPHSSHLCIFNFTPNSSFLFPWAAQRVREWGLQLVHSTCSLLLLSPHTLSLLQHGVSLIGSNSSKATSLWVIFTWKSLRNSLLQCGSPVGVTAPARRCVSMWSPVHGVAVQARSLLQPGFFKGSQLPSGLTHLLWGGIPPKLQG